MTHRSFGLWLLATASVGLIVRLAYAYALVKSRPLLGDGLEFHNIANLLAEGRGFIQPDPWLTQHIVRPTADKPPLYPLLEAGLSLLGGRSWQSHQVVGCIAGAATVGVVGLVGREASGARVGLVAALLTAVSPLLVATAGSLRSESVFVLLVAGVLWAALRYRRRPTRSRAAVYGAAIGLSTLTRSEAVLLLVLLIPCIGWRGTGIAAIVCALVLTPWLARCWHAFGRPVLISTNLGGLVAGANCDQAYHGEFLGQWSFSCFPPAIYTNEAQESQALLSHGVHYASGHLGRVPVVVAARVGRTFELFRPLQGATMERFYEGADLTVEQAGIVVFYLMAALAVSGGLTIRRHRGTLWILVAPVVMVTIVSITAYGFTRFRVGAEPGLTVLAAVGLDRLIVVMVARSRNRKTFDRG